MVTKKKTTKKALPKAAPKKAKVAAGDVQAIAVGEAHKEKAITGQPQPALGEAVEQAQVQVEAPKPKKALKEAELAQVRCVSCGTYLVIGEGSVKFQCPNCAVLMGRCDNCRALGRIYNCACGFVGP